MLGLFDRVERAGVRVNRAALERKFNFTVSGIKTAGIDISIFLRLGELVTSLAEQDGFVCELRGIFVFPIICDPLICTRDDFVTHKRKSFGYFVGRNIAIDVWKKARKAKRLALTTDMLKSSVQVVPDSHWAGPSWIDKLTHIAARTQ